VGGGRKKKAWCPWDWKHIWLVLLVPEDWAGGLEFSSLMPLGVVWHISPDVLCLKNVSGTEQPAFREKISEKLRRVKEYRWERD